MNTRTLFLALAYAGSAMAQTSLTGAEVFSNDTVRYGRWEIRMQVAAVPGSVSSFFTYYNNSYLGSPEPWREIDIEILGNKSEGFQSNLITGNAATKVTSEVFHARAPSLAADFHTYVLEWTADSIVWRLDGTRLRKSDSANSVAKIRKQVTDLRDHSQTYRMNLWASDAVDWVGTLDTATLPVVQVVNWITYSKWTPGQGPGGSDFTPVWTDDFDKFDTKRWSRGDWTFDGNLATFAASNAVAKDGYLVLLLSTSGTAGILPATLPKDPQGNSRTVGINPSSVARPFIVRTPGSGRLDFEAPEGGARLHALDGRLLAGAPAGTVHWEHLPSGLSILHTAQGSVRVTIP